MIKKKIVVLGAGGWGTTLATLLVKNNQNAILWTHEPEVAEEISSYNSNSVYLSGVELPEKLIATTENKFVNDADIVVNTIPTQYIRKTLTNHNFNLKNKLIVNGSKGIENNSLMRISEIFESSGKIDLNNYVILTGPSHAEEVSREMPTTVVAASKKKRHTKLIQNIFSNFFFRVYRSKDVIGSELGGALKNVIAIAAGIIDGLGYGDNTKAALITRGLTEMSRLGSALGASPLTFSGLSGLGDLIVTCDSLHSRNRSVGERIGKGQSIDEILKSMKMVAEGINTTESAVQLGISNKVEMPIAEQMYEILFNHSNPNESINELMNRDFKKEWW